MNSEQQYDCETIEAVRTPEVSGFHYRRLFKSAQDGIGNIYAISSQCVAQYSGRAITERKRAVTAAVQESVAFLDRIINAIGDPVFVKDEQSAFVFVNDAFCTFLGGARDTLIGTTGVEFSPPDQMRHFLEVDQKVLSTGEEVMVEESLTHGDGDIRTIMTRKSRYVDGKGVKFIVGVIRDMTEYRQQTAQLQQAQKMEAVGRLTGGVVHDFNNLLTVIMGYTELCRNAIEPSNPIRTWLNEVLLTTDEAVAITRQLLNFAHKQVVDARVVDLNDLVTSILGLLRRLIGEDIKLAWNPGSTFRPVKMDPTQVTQILVNLCVNARDAITGVGEIRIESGSIVIAADNHPQNPEWIPGRYTFFAVSDTGCGMDSKTLAHLYEPFFTTKVSGKGTGLGLATVYEIVHQSSGFIHVDSKPGKGTTFKICLPEVESYAMEAIDVTVIEGPRGNGETILLVEDEKSLRIACGLLLESLGYKVLVSDSPADALATVSQHAGEIDLLLTDVIMPEMDGQRLAERIVSTRPDIKILLMSGYTPDVIAAHVPLDPELPFIKKPFARKDIACKLHHLLM